MSERSILAQVWTRVVMILLAILTGIASAIIVSTFLESEAHAQSARAKLSDLKVGEERPLSGYEREDYPHWSNAQEFGWRLPADTPDASSCDARDAALIRDGEGERVRSGCEVSGGRYVDPYTGQTFNGSDDLEADHIVPLAEAHRSGSVPWSEARKERFANDPSEVLMVDGSENASKSDSDPKEYKPDRRAYWCTYATRWINVKDNWNLSVDPEEKKNLRQMLGTCSGSSGASSPDAQPSEQQNSSDSRSGGKENPREQQPREERREQLGEGNPQTTQSRNNEIQGDQDRRGDANVASPQRLPDTGGPALLPGVLLLIGSGTVLRLVSVRRGRR